MEGHVPTPGPAHEVLTRLVGTWTSDERMLPSPWSPNEETRQGVCTARMLEGFFLVTDYEQRAGDDVTFRGHGVYAWDPATSEYLMYWFDSMGGPGGVARGTFADDVLTFLNSSPMGQHRYRYAFQPDGSYTFEMAMSADGEAWSNFMEATYRQG